LTIHDILVSSNVIILRYGSNEFADVGRVGFYTAAAGSPIPTGVIIDRNQYFLGDPATGQHFSLPDRTTSGTLLTAAEWQEAGFDTSSEFQSLVGFQSSS
jgi:hypothetical protein